MGGHSGGVNLASGALRQPVHGEVVGFHDGKVTGEATRRDRGRRNGVLCHGEVVKFVNYLNWALSYWRGEGGLTEAMGGGSAELD